MIQVDCGCGRSFNVPDSAAGKNGKCPKCGAFLAVPDLASTPLPPRSTPTPPPPVPTPAVVSPAPAAAPARSASLPWYFWFCRFASWVAIVGAVLGLVITLVRSTDKSSFTPDDYAGLLNGFGLLLSGCFSLCLLDGLGSLVRGR